MLPSLCSHCDVISAVNGNAIKDSRALAREISTMAPGSSGKLDILRNGDSEPQNGSARGVPHLGLSVAPASDVAGAGNKGVVVTAVDPDGPAAEHGLQSGDAILDVGGKSVGTVAELRNAPSEAKSGGKHDVLMRIKTAENMHFIAMPIGWAWREGPPQRVLQAERRARIGWWMLSSLGSVSSYNDGELTTDSKTSLETRHQKARYSRDSRMDQG